VEKKISRAASMAFIIIIYLAALCIGYIAYRLTQRSSILISFLAADVAATIFVWLVGVFFSNSSVYDPYWSVAPPFLLAGWLIIRGGKISFIDIALISAVLFWAIRLTYNWAVNWKGMQHEDWRYSDLRADSGKMWQIVNLLGIHLMPTVLVFFGMASAYNIVFSQSPAGILFYIGLAIALASPAMQMAADAQMKRHRAAGGGRCINTGLWKYSRHPNYLGEICFWWGLFIMQAGCVEGGYMAAAGPILITLLFVFISVPMMEKHIVSKCEDYVQYQSEVSALVPWFKKGS